MYVLFSRIIVWHFPLGVIFKCAQNIVVSRFSSKFSSGNVVTVSDTNLRPLRQFVTNPLFPPQTFTSGHISNTTALQSNFTFVMVFILCAISCTAGDNQWNIGIKLCALMWFMGWFRVRNYAIELPWWDLHWIDMLFIASYSSHSGW